MLNPAKTFFGLSGFPQSNSSVPGLPNKETDPDILSCVWGHRAVALGAFSRLDVLPWRVYYHPHRSGKGGGAINMAKLCMCLFSGHLSFGLCMLLL